MCGKRLSPEKVAYLWLLLNENKWNVTEISRKLEISRSCIYKYKKRGISDTDNKKIHKGGRPRKLNKKLLVKCESY
jgi:predicted transcriptional regulator